MTKTLRANQTGAAVSASYLELEIGDHAPMLGDRAIFTAGAPRWYALRVLPQAEDQAEAWLARRGVYAFHPVMERRLVRLGKPRVYHRRYLPGYVFARFSGEPVVHRLAASPFISGAICRADGTWGPLNPSELRALHDMRRVDAASEARRISQAARRQREGALKVGDRVMFRVGPFAELRAEVISLRACTGTTVRLHLFGREVDLQADNCDLIALKNGS